MQITGVMGSLSEYDINETMNRQLNSFLGCFAKRADKLRFLSGKFEMMFRVKSSGKVRWVYPKLSTLGDRPTEQCMLEAAKATKFPRPYGGEVEFSFPIELDLIDHRRAPRTWEASKISPVLEEHRADIAKECELAKRESYQLTIYIGRGGQVLAAGGSVEDADSLEHLDCVTQAVQHWSMPDPGRRPTKVAFAVIGQN